MTPFAHLNITRTDPLPSPQQLLEEIPCSPKQRKFVETTRQDIRNILDGVDNRFLLIVGPCSIHDITAAKEYASLLYTLSKQLGDMFCIVMRVYFDKPRTVMGWKGLLNDPLLDNSHDIATGLRWTRQLLLDLAEMGVATACEFLDPAAAYYFSDLISWGCIGARTASSQVHRQLASSLPMPVAFKNSIDGDVGVAVNGILNASKPHTFIGMDPCGHSSIVHTAGSQHGHLVLRGGEGKPNYHPQAISEALACLRTAELSPRLLIDCSHDNSMRQHELQATVFQSVLNQTIEGNQEIKGMLLESHLNPGHQTLTPDLSQLKYGVSLTDPCMDWATTEQLILWGYSLMKRDRMQKKEEKKTYVASGKTKKR